MPRPFIVLWRAFFAQFFTSENVRSDVQLRQTIVWVLAFLLVPGIILVVQIFFDYQGIVARAIRFQNFDLVDDTLEWMVFVFVTHAMVTVGFVAVFVWDALAFDRRDAMVLGPLPVSGATIVAAKLAALGTFLVGTALLVNLPTAVMFAFGTANSLGGGTLILHFAGLLTATAMAGAFVFASLVVARGVLGLVAGARLAQAGGSLLQFLFVVALLSFVILCPAVWDVPHAELINPTVTGWLPTSWFLGVFERMRGSTRAYFMPLATRGLLWLAASVAAAIVTSVIGFRRQMQLALAPSAHAPTTAVRLLRALARPLTGSDRRATAICDFILLTIVRNKSQQTLIAMNAAIGVALAFAGFVQLRSFWVAGHPAPAIVAIPLLVAFWLTVGIRAAFHVPSELPGAWSFHANPALPAARRWSAVRASMLAMVLPPVILITALLAAVTGARIALLHAALTLFITVLVVELSAHTVDFIPFTRPYVPGHAKLRTRWPLYLLGMFFSSGVPSRLFEAMVDRPRIFAIVLANIAVSITALELIGRLRETDRPPIDDDAPDEVYRMRVLDLRAIVPTKN